MVFSKFPLAQSGHYERRRVSTYVCQLQLYAVAVLNGARSTQPPT